MLSTLSLRAAFVRPVALSARTLSSSPASTKPRQRRKPPQVARELEEETLKDVQKAIDKKAAHDAKAAASDESGGPRGEEPTRFGDWERKGRVSDF